MNRDTDILVYADWQGLSRPVWMGTLHRAIVRGEEILSFEYDRDWLTRQQPFLLDPRLQFVQGRQFADKENPFGLFLDSAPDRWGRLLINRRVAIESGSSRPVLFDSDYLLAVSDTCRMGALRFRTDPDGPFLMEDHATPVPPLHSLRTLEEASREIESADSDDPALQKWLALLLAPGTSLGGARPKSNVIDACGNLWIAKFPSRSDEYDVGAWEGFVHQMAERAGIQTSPSRTDCFSKFGKTFLTQRFDRRNTQRIHFASAMNLLGYHDGDDGKIGASYLDLVDFIERYGARVTQDLEELWRRIVFNILVHNTDDHLRNHGFLLTESGWILSPAYDINAQPWPGGLALNIDENNNACEIDLVLSVGQYFRLRPDRQLAIVNEVTAALKNWQGKASSANLDQSEIDRMESAFLL